VVVDDYLPQDGEGLVEVPVVVLVVVPVVVLVVVPVVVPVDVQEE
jgi:hypothetical protein